MFDVSSLQSHPQSTFIAVFEDKPKYPFTALTVVTMSFAKIDVCAKITFTYFLLTNGKEDQMYFGRELFIWENFRRIRSYVHHVVGDVKFNAQEKLSRC